MPILIDGERLTLADVERVARDGESVALDPAARAKVLAARAVIENALANERKIYGVSTGFGSSGRTPAAASRTGWRGP